MNKKKYTQHAANKDDSLYGLVILEQWRDSSIQLGYINALTDETSLEKVIHYASYKSKIIALYVLCGDNYDFDE